MMMRLNSQFAKTLKLTGPRALLGSHWGLVCPSDTPDGESCGLTKNLTILAHVTTVQDRSRLALLCTVLGMEDISHYASGEHHEDENYMVLLNGQVIGLVRTPLDFTRDLRTLRRRGKIGATISISLNKMRRLVSIDTDDGRICRPLLIVEDWRPKMAPEKLHRLALWAV
jgi:DNA-directed RNA polymerase III subunit RPC2